MTATPVNRPTTLSPVSYEPLSAGLQPVQEQGDTATLAAPSRRRFRHLMRSLASSLAFDSEPEVRPLATPFVYTTAIQSSADLVTSLTGISRLARELGFQSHPETCYAPDGSSASWHADHGDLSLSLSVDCNPRRGTVSIAVSGLDGELTHSWFQWIEASLFGSC